MKWLVLNDGVAQRVTAGDIDASEEARVIDRVLIPLTEGGTGRAGAGGAYTVSGEVSGKWALIRLLDEGHAIADIAICLHSRAAHGLWKQLHSAARADAAVGPDGMPANAPWCAVLYHCPESMLPSWFDHWTKTIGMALVRREGW